jgi:hypothetical protein
VCLALGVGDLLVSVSQVGEGYSGLCRQGVAHVAAEVSLSVFKGHWCGDPGGPTWV